MTQPEVIFRAEKLCKSFGSTKANVDIDFTLYKGEVRGLVGENGSGKSTLLSQIAGVFERDSGSMYLGEEIYDPKTPLDANARKIGIVVQEFGVIASLPAAVNVFLGHMGSYSKAGIVNINKMHTDIRELSKKWDWSDVPLTPNAGTLNVETRKQIELLRALAIDPEILILDEITQALSYDNRQRLYKLINRFKEMGRSVLVISHDLEEIYELADNLTILRDGKVVDTVGTEEITIENLKRMMVGREITEAYYRTDDAPDYEGDVVFSVRDLNVRNEVKGLSFDLHAGEILGFCGLSDSGIHTIGKALYGLEQDASGKIELTQQSKFINTSQQALNSNMAYVPKERDGEGLMIQASIRENFCLTQMENLKGKMGLLWSKAMNMSANGSKDAFSVRCENIFQDVGNLSGGNKQKINLGRWLAKDLDVLILDCPTRGVDIGVKAYIYQLLKDLKGKGLGIILISDELQEVLGMVDRLFVIKNGEVAKEALRGSGFTEEAIVEVML